MDPHPVSDDTDVTIRLPGGGTATLPLDQLFSPSRYAAIAIVDHDGMLIEAVDDPAMAALGFATAAVRYVRICREDPAMLAKLGQFRAEADEAARRDSDEAG